MVSRLRPPSPALRRALLDLRDEHAARHLESDPVRYVHRFPDAADREVVGWLAATLAFGRVAGIFRSLDDLLGRLGSRPAQAIDALTPARGRCRLAGFRHRWIGEAELLRALLVLRRFRRRHGSLEAAFRAGDPGGPDLAVAIDAWSDAALEGAGSATRALRFLFPSPARGSACKRMNLFLRWMVRPADGTDLGLWPGVGAHRLVVPLDVHVAFMGRALRLTRRRTADWKMAAEITRGLARIAPDDPVGFDWALSRPGILGLCRGRRDPVACPPCRLRPHCRP